MSWRDRVKAVLPWVGGGPRQEVVRSGIDLADAGFWSNWLGLVTSTGQLVTQHSALNLSTWWACTRLLSETTGMLGVSVYRRRADGGRDEVKDHWLYGLVHERPNADMTATEFWEASTFALCQTGNFMAEKGLVGRRVVSLTPMPGAQLYRDSDGAKRYRFQDRGKSYDLPDDKVFHVKGFGAGGDLGLSPLAFARQSLGLAQAANEQAAKMFANGLAASGFIETGGATLTEEQRKLWKERINEWVGSDKAGKIFTLEGGFKFNPLTINPEDMQMLESRAFSVEDVCRWLRVPPFMVGHTQNSTSWGTGLESQNIGFLTYALGPYLRRYEARIGQWLLLPEERGQYYAEFNRDALLAMDSAARAAYMATLAQNGYLTRDEGRAKLNLPPAPDGAGKVLTVQSNLIPIDMLGKVAPSQTQTGATAQDVRQAVVDAFREVMQQIQESRR